MAIIQVAHGKTTIDKYKGSYPVPYNTLATITNLTSYEMKVVSDDESSQTIFIAPNQSSQIKVSHDYYVYEKHTGFANMSDPVYRTTPEKLSFIQLTAISWDILHRN
jgi:hypothetical protein